MKTATANASICEQTDEVLTRAEIEQRYDEEWVLVADPELDEQFDVVKGKVICHHKDREVFDDEVMKIKPFPQESAFLYLGKYDGTYIL